MFYLNDTYEHVNTKYFSRVIRIECGECGTGLKQSGVGCGVGCVEGGGHSAYVSLLYVSAVSVCVLVESRG